MTDLRDFLDQVRRTRPSDLVVVDREVSPDLETAAIVAKLEDRHRTPIVSFPRVTGSAFPVVSSVAGSMGRIALALGCPLKETSARWAAAVERRMPPAVVGAAPVYDEVLFGDAVDLSILPALRYHEHDAAAPYITGAIVAARDPETGKVNLSFHRLMRLDQTRATIFIERGKHLDRIHRRYGDRGAPMPIAAFIGWHPAWALGALYSGSADVEEYDVIGGLLGAPLEVCRARASDLVVPARAEMVLEGTVGTERVEEGPFGEFTGYGTGTTRSPIFQVEVFARRAGAIYQDVVSGHMEHLVLPMLGIEHRTLADARRACPGVRAVVMAAPMTAIVSLEKTSDAEPRRIIDAILDGDIYAKQVIVVDADVDPRDFRSVLSAMALTVQADRSIVVKPNSQGTPLDPSCPAADGKVAKLGIDATRSLVVRRSITRNSFPKELWDRIDLGPFTGR
jgi:UbiD family decarboxylase